jgi:hypothetical protein
MCVCTPEKRTPWCGTCGMHVSTPTAAVIPIMYLPYALCWGSCSHHASRT